MRGLAEFSSMMAFILCVYVFIDEYVYKGKLSNYLDSLYKYYKNNCKEEVE